MLLWLFLTTCNVICGALSCVALVNLCWPTFVANARLLIALRRWFVDWRSYASFVCTLGVFRARQLLSRAAVTCDKIDDTGRYALTISLNDAAATIVRFDIRPRRNATGGRLVDVVDLDAARGGAAASAVDGKWSGARRALLLSYARYVVDPVELATAGVVTRPPTPPDAAPGRAFGAPSHVIGVYEDAPMKRVALLEEYDAARRPF
jgi:hypothetical protein